MLARRRKFEHPTAGAFELPLLVPSFSSKGFSLEKEHKDSDHEYSAVAYELAEFGSVSVRSVLISAYDLHFRHFEAPHIPEADPKEHLRKASLVFLDSGGYELTEDFDSAEVRRSNYTPKSGYGRNEYAAVVADILQSDPSLPLIAANFDHDTSGCSLAEQVSCAREFFDRFPKCMSTFIMKPVTPDSRMIHVDRLSNADLKNLRGFGVIGVTEKELGKNLREKLQQLSALRRKLDDAGIEAPIHLWGGLDPVMTPLFFFAGAEIFDGISWLRYAFQHGAAVNRESALILDDRLGVGAKKDVADRWTSITNVRIIEKLEGSLQSWVDHDGDRFEMFDKHVRDDLEAAYRAMLTWDGSSKKGAK